MVTDNKQAVLVHVASNIKRLRADQNLSQQQLADSSGVSRRMIAAIENGNANISLAKLAQIASELGVNFATIVSPHESKASSHKNILTWRGKNPNSEARLCCSLASTGQVELWFWQIAQNDYYLAEPDPEGWFEMVLVIEGQLTLKFDDRVEHLKAGDSSVYHSSQSYSYHNQSTGMLKFVRNAVI